MNQTDYDAINEAVKAVDERLYFSANIPSKFDRDVLGIPTRGIVFLRIGERRFAAPCRDGLAAPFDVTTPEETKARAVEAAKELRAFGEKNL